MSDTTLKAAHHWSKLIPLPGIASLAAKGPIFIPIGKSVGVDSDRWHLFFQHCGLTTTAARSPHVVNTAVLDELFLGVGAMQSRTVDILWLHSNGNPSHLAFETMADSCDLHEWYFHYTGNLSSECYRRDGAYSNAHGPAVIHYNANAGTVRSKEYWLYGNQLTGNEFCFMRDAKSVLDHAVCQIVPAASAVCV